jgi:hypothetical protein
MSAKHHETEGRNIPTLDHLLAGGEMLPAQLPSPSDWSAEKKLAAAVLGSALIEVRDHWGDPPYRRRLAQDLEWIGSDEAEWPFSFVRLCQLFDLEPDYVRQMVKRWLAGPAGGVHRQVSVHRHAA